MKCKHQTDKGKEVPGELGLKFKNEQFRPGRYLVHCNQRPMNQTYSFLTKMKLDSEWVKFKLPTLSLIIQS